MEKYKYNDVLNTVDIDPFCIKDGLVYARKHEINKIRVMVLNHYEEYGFTSANELDKIKLDTALFKEFNFITDLTLENHIGISKDGINNIYNLKSLKYFAFENHDIKPDLNNLPNIETLVFKYNNSIRNLNHLENLKDLLVIGLKTNDCSFLSGLDNLKMLRLSGGSFSNLNGIEDSRLLNRIDINYNSNIEDISIINKLSSLEILNIEKCNKLKDYNILSGNNSIKELFIDRLDSLTFIPSMEKLEKINFWDCRDGNINYLLESNTLKNINYYPNKKHYTHKLEEIKEKIK
jgi:internalin A